MNTFYYQPGPAGSGKTFQLSHWSIERVAAHEKVLIAQPTKQLLRATQAQIKQLNPTVKITMIVSTTMTGRVAQRVVQHMESAAPHEGEILLITHETLKRLPTTFRKFWHMVCDEMPAVLDHQELRIAKTHNHITDHIDAKEQLVDGLTVLKPGNRVALEAIQINASEDQNIATFRDIVGSLLSGDHLVLVNTDAYAALLTNPQGKGHIDFFSILLSSFVEGYRTTTFMGANILETELVVLWSKLLNINWLIHPDMGGKLRYQTHQNGDRLTLCYLFDGKPSKGFLSLEDDAGETTVDRITAYVAHYMSDSRFLWHANKDQLPGAFDARDRLPMVAHGIDSPHFKSAHNVALLSAMNRRSAAYAFLEKLGVTSEQAQITLSHQSDYQAMMRCSLRDPQAIAPVRVIVGSKDAAEWIAGKFPNCAVEKLDSGIAEPRSGGRPKGPSKALTSTERSRLSRSKKKNVQ